MLKPIGKPKSEKQLKPVKNKEAEKPAQIIMSLVNGREIFVNADTGEIVDQSHNRFTPSYELFNNEKASILISSMAQGRTLLESLESACMTKATFSMWLMNNEEFASSFEKARSSRAQHVHEKFYQNTIGELTGELPEDKEDLSLHLAKLAAIEKRQKILGVQKKEDNPVRFSDKEMNQSMAASVAISIDPDIISKMQTRFETKLDHEENLDLSGSRKQLDDILEAEFKEVTSE